MTDHAERVAQALRLAREGPADLSVGELADHVHYSPAHFARAFAGTVGMGPGQYLTAVRMDRAKRLLLTNDDPVIDIATAVGFDSLSSFTRRFTATVGITPGRLRRLADDLGDRVADPFGMPHAPGATVHVELHLPEGFSPRGDPTVWLGWYPQPAPIGLPLGGRMVRLRPSVELALCPGAPYLLGFAVPAQSDPSEHLVPRDPVVGGHPAPVLGPARIRLCFAPSSLAHGLPMLSALPSLAPR